MKRIKEIAAALAMLQVAIAMTVYEVISGEKPN